MADVVRLNTDSNLEIEQKLEALSAQNIILSILEAVLSGSSNIDLASKAEQKIEQFIDGTLESYMGLYLQHMNAKDRARFLLAFNQIFQVVKAELIRVGLNYSKSRVSDLGDFINTKDVISTEIDKLNLSDEEKETYRNGMLEDCNILWDAHEEFSKNFMGSLQTQFQTTFEQLDNILAEVQAEKTIRPAGSQM